VVDRPLQDPLEAQGGLGIAAVVLGQAGHGGLHCLVQVRAQAGGIGTSGLEDRLGGGAVE